MDGFSLRDSFARFAGALRPVLEVAEGSGRRRAVGTAILLEGEDVRIVLTAHHVLRGPENKSIGRADDEAFRWPVEYWVLEPTTADLLDADVAWAPIAAEQDDGHSFGGLPIELALGDFPEVEGPSYLAAGFPASKAKVRQAVASVEAQLMVAVVEPAPAEVSERLGLDPRVQMAFRYSQAGRTGLEGAPAVGARPKGMSGGGVFLNLQVNYGEGLSTAVPFLVGVLTEYHAADECLVATRIRHVIAPANVVTSQPATLYVPRSTNGDRL